MSAPATLDDWIDRAAALRGAGRVPEAIDAYRHVLALDATLPNCWYNLAWLLRRAREPQAALEAYAQALRHGIDGPEEVHLNRGVILLEDLHRPDDAHAELQRAVALNPRYAPAWLNLGNLHEDTGARDAAREAYTRALAIAPGDALALARLAGVSSASSPADPLVQQLHRALASPGLAPGDRAHLGFGLARLLDGCGEFGAAFEAARAANAASRASVQPPVRYDRAAWDALVDAVIGQPALPPAQATDGPVPIFVCGMFRSGSTLVEQLLAAHGGVQPGGELDLLPALVDHTLQPYPAALATLDAGRRQAVADAYRAALAARFPQAVRVSDKRPDNLLHVGLIRALWPDARIVITRRHPLDNALSLFFLHLDHTHAYALDLHDIGHHLQAADRLCAAWQARFGDAVLLFDYDRFVAAPQVEGARLLQHCGLQWNDAVLDFHRLRNPVRTASVWQVRQPLHARSSGRWRHYRAQLAPLATQLGLAPDQTS